MAKKPTKELSPKENLLAALVQQDRSFSALPLFMVDEEDRRRKPSLTYKTDITLAGAPGTFKWQVSADLTFGFPDHFDRKVFKILEALILQQPRPIKNPVHFSLYRILQMLGLPPFGVHFSRMRAAIQRIAAVKVHAQFISASQASSRHESQTFHILNDVTFQDETFDNELGAGSHTLTLGDWYLDVLNRETTSPVDIAIFQSLQNPIASRLYEFLLIQFPDVLENKLKGWDVSYSTLCQMLPVKEVSWASSPKRQFEDAHNELIVNDLIDRVEWSKTEQGWQLVYIPGRRFFDATSRRETPSARPESSEPRVTVQMAMPEEPEKTVIEEFPAVPNSETVEADIESKELPISPKTDAQENRTSQPEENVSEVGTTAEENAQPMNSPVAPEEPVVSGGRAYAEAVSEAAGTGEPGTGIGSRAENEKGSSPSAGPLEDVQSEEIDKTETGAIATPEQVDSGPEKSAETSHADGESALPEGYSEANPCSVRPSENESLPYDRLKTEEEDPRYDSFTATREETTDLPTSTYTSSQLQYFIFSEKGSAMAGLQNGETHSNL